MAKDIPVRAVRVGDFVQDKFDGTARLVRKVEVVLSLDNGVQDTHDASETVVWELPAPLPDVVAVQEELDQEVALPYEPIPDQEPRELPDFEPNITESKKTKRVPKK